MLRDIERGKALKDWALERIAGMEDLAWRGRRLRVSIIFGD